MHMIHFSPATKYLIFFSRKWRKYRKMFQFLIKIKLLNGRKWTLGIQLLLQKKFNIFYLQCSQSKYFIFYLRRKTKWLSDCFFLICKIIVLLELHGSYFYFVLFRLFIKTWLWNWRYALNKSRIYTGIRFMPFV